MNTRIQKLPVLVACLATAFAFAHAQQGQTGQQNEKPKLPTDIEIPEQPEGLALPQVDPNNATLVAAAQVEPVDPELVKALIPEKLAGMQRVKLDGKLYRLGDAGMTTVRAAYVGDAGETLELEITDPGGMPVSEPTFLPLLPAGTTRDTDRSQLEGLLVDGHPSVIERPTTPKPARLQVGVGTRMRLTFSGRNIEVNQLPGVAADLDLAGLARLIK